MSSIDSFASEIDTVAAIKPYFLLDTNQDETVAPEELVAPVERIVEDAGAKEVPKVSAADTLTDLVAAALLDVHLAENPASLVQNAVAAYHVDDESLL